MEIIVASRRSSKAAIVDHANRVVIDLTSKAAQPWVRFSPFYPHGAIPVPGWPDLTAQSVEGIWQGLKVFEHEGTDLSRLELSTMRGIKRSGAKRGRVLGHQAGPSGELLSYVTARRAIYLPAYRWVLEHCLQAEVAALRELAQEKSIRLLDYETNCSVDDTTAPLSHAFLVACFVRGEWPG
ncbi:DUF6939 family protein [Chitinimonas lacunae]|uniref:DUF6939 family protein n=1 Tax=Chitinimonas lacunae TaxID=1963018 RepID=A0ABV8MMS2_9NEIS